MSEESIKDRVSTVMRIAGNLLSGTIHVPASAEDTLIERAVRRAWKIHDETLRQNDQRRTTQHATKFADGIGTPKP